jgi:prephenate dehydrogenase
MRSANVVGLGLIGGSLCAALCQRGWIVHGVDVDSARTAEALDKGLISDSTLDPSAEVTFVATPVSATIEAVRRALAETTGVVTDVGGVKALVVAEVSDARFVGGHPMAGSELVGLAGADPELFVTATWVLCPSASTSDASFEKVASVVKELGAEIIALDANRHDELVAIVSHLPHLTAATLMGLASERSQEHVAVLRLAAGGFRDMTRIASGHPGIWLDVCRENKDAILGALDSMQEGLREMREIVERGDSKGLQDRLQRARVARSNIPGRVKDLLDVCEFRIPIPDRSGAAAEIFGLAAELGVNIANFEVSHSAEGSRGVLIVVVDTAQSDVFRGGLLARGFRPIVQRIE